MSGHTYIFEEIEILVYGSGRHFEFGPKNQISPNGIDGDFFLMLIHTFLKLLTKYQLYVILFGVITHFDCTIDIIIDKNLNFQSQVKSIIKQLIQS